MAAKGAPDTLAQQAREGFPVSSPGPALQVARLLAKPWDTAAVRLMAAQDQLALYCLLLALARQGEGTPHSFTMGSAPPMLAQPRTPNAWVGAGGES
jgi:hypothetical protein